MTRSPLMFMTALLEKKAQLPATGRWFQTCFSTMGCPEKDLPAILELAGRHDIDCLELRSVADRIDLPEYFRGLPGGIDGVRDMLAERVAIVRILGTSFKLVGDTETGRQSLLGFASLAEDLSVPYLRIFGGGKWGTPLTDGDFREAVEFLDWWKAARETNAWNVDVLIETHDAFSASEPFQRLFEQLGRPSGIIWDSHHTWKLGGETPSESWNQLRDFVYHVHIKDSISQPSARHPYTYVLPGTGEMPAREVMHLLRRDAFVGAVSLEWEKMWHPYLPDLSEALAAAHEQRWW